jgi:hypothetical protein
MLFAGRMEARASGKRDEIRATLRDVFVCPVTTTGGMASRHVKGQRADDPQTESANSHPSGLATTTRMAARPSRCLQRRPLHPSISQLLSSLCGRARALELPLFKAASRICVSLVTVVDFAAR